MKVKTSITPRRELVGRLDRVERACTTEGEARDRTEIEIIDRNAERLNREAMDTLEYQQLP